MNEPHYLALLARAPTLGKSKTRLIPRLGQEGACSFAHAALTDLLHLMRTVPSCHRILFYTPKDAGPHLQAYLERERLDGSWELQCQPDTPDLGGRLAGALECLQNIGGKAQSGAARPTVTFIGMDCFELTVQSVSTSMHKVSANDGTANMTPACDGGYVMLTVPLHCDGKKIFSGIPWSTDRTGQMQLQRLRDAGLTCDAEVPALPDVDEPQDLERLWATRQTKLSDFPRTMDFLGKVMQE